MDVSLQLSTVELLTYCHKLRDHGWVVGLLCPLYTGLCRGPFRTFGKLSGDGGGGDGGGVKTTVEN